MVAVFSVTAMFILFRESLEASVVVAVMLQMCDRLKLQRLKRWVWIGAFSGVGVSILIGAIFIIVFYVAKNAVFSGYGKVVFEGYLLLLASFLITVLAFAMLKFKNYEAKWERKMELMAAQTVNRGAGRASMFVLAFTTTLREGLETVIFLAGVSAGIPVQSIPLGGFVGLLCGLSVGIVLYYTGRKIKDIAWFLFAMTGLLFFIGAGLTSHALTYWQDAGWFGYAEYPDSARPWQNQQLWDWSGCCSDDVNQNRFFGLVGALFGYTSAGTAIWLFAYFGYWVQVIFVLICKWRSGTLLDAESKMKRKFAKASAVEAGKGAPDHVELDVKDISSEESSQTGSPKK